MYANCMRHKGYRETFVFRTKSIQYKFTVKDYHQLHTKSFKRIYILGRYNILYFIVILYTYRPYRKRYYSKKFSSQSLQLQKCIHMCCRVSFVVVCVLILMGTFYDVILRYKTLRRANKKDNNNITIIKESKSLRSNGNFDRRITISKLWTMTKHNGSLGILSKKNYIVLS